jgi:drug/metabolite transporter (DMT)-like permease
MYPLFLILWLSLDRQPPNRLTLFRLILAIPAIFLLTQAEGGQVDLIGFGAMLIAAALYALHIPINQRVLFDMPAPTVTMYTLFAMSAVVVPVFLFSGTSALPNDITVWWPLIGLTVVTFLSRLALFLGVKHLGGMQTALLGLSELLVAIAFAHLWLGERFSTQQWVGALLLVTSLLLVVADRSKVKKPHHRGWLSWLRSPNLPPDFHL